MGCWSGELGYLVLLTGDRFIGVGETGDFATKPLMEMTHTPLVQPATASNRVRVDCVAGDDGGWISVYVNETPVTTVPISAEVSGFDAVGFTGTSTFEGTSYAIDDVSAVAERPPPPDSIGDIETFPEASAGETWFRHQGTEFVFPDNWAYQDLQKGGGEFFTVPGAWSFGVSPAPGGNWIALAVGPGIAPEELGATPEEFAAALGEFVTSASGTVVDGPNPTTIGDLPAFRLTLDDVAGEISGRLYSAEMAVAYGDSSTYVLLAQYSEDFAEVTLAAWEEMLASFDP